VILLLASIALLSALALAMVYAAMRFAGQRTKPLLVIGLSGLYFVGVFSLFAYFAAVFA